MHEPTAGPVPGEGFGPAGRALLLITKAAAVVGGLMFVGLVGMSIVSIVGRKLISAPVPGDVEVLQMCSAVAASTFFAYTHLNHGDVKVDFFTAKASAATVAWLDALGSTLVCLFGFLIAWRTAVGAISLQADGETSAILGWPTWIAQAAMVPGFVLLGLAGLYTATRHVRRSHLAASA